MENDNKTSENIENIVALTENSSQTLAEENVAIDNLHKNPNEEIKIETTIKKKKNNKLLFSILFLLANVLVILVVILMEDRTGEMEPWANVKGYFIKNWYFFAISYSVYLMLIAGDTIVFSNLTKKMKLRNNFNISLKVSIYGRYYDRITPWAIGGEPYQLAYFMRNGMKASDSLAVTASRHIIRFFISGIAVIVIMIASHISTNIWVMITAISSISCGLILPIFMVICCFKPKLGKIIAKFVVSLLYKLKLIKDYDKELAKLQHGVDNFLKGIEYLSANKKMVVIIGLVSLTEVLANNSIPYFIMRGLDIELQFWNIFVLCIFVNYASSLAPTPGGAGLAELSFYAIFASYIGGGYLFWAVLTWRLAFFYVPIAIGFILQFVEEISAIAKVKRHSL